MHPKVDEYIDQVSQWQEELRQLRKIALDCSLTETFKWRAPCYTDQDNNILILGHFKTGCVISFFKGALLKDPQGILSKPGENTRASRLIKFTNVEEIVKQQKVIKAFIQQAIAVEKAGLKVNFEKESALAVPEEFQNKLKELPALKTAFAALTPGRQRGYLIYFNGAKQSKNRAARVEKYILRILDGKGFHDCVCGLSKKMPTCDGSHKQLK